MQHTVPTAMLYPAKAINSVCLKHHLQFSFRLSVCVSFSVCLCLPSVCPALSPSHSIPIIFPSFIVSFQYTSAMPSSNVVANGRKPMSINHTSQLTQAKLMSINHLSHPTQAKPTSRGDHLSRLTPANVSDQLQSRPRSADRSARQSPSSTPATPSCHGDMKTQNVKFFVGGDGIDDVDVGRETEISSKTSDSSSSGNFSGNVPNRESSAGQNLEPTSTKTYEPHAKGFETVTEYSKPKAEDEIADCERGFSATHSVESRIPNALLGPTIDQHPTTFGLTTTQIMAVPRTEINFGSSDGSRTVRKLNVQSGQHSRTPTAQTSSDDVVVAWQRTSGDAVDTKKRIDDNAHLHKINLNSEHLQTCRNTQSNNREQTLRLSDEYQPNHGLSDEKQPNYTLSDEDQPDRMILDEYRSNHRHTDEYPPNHRLSDSSKSKIRLLEQLESNEGLVDELECYKQSDQAARYSQRRRQDKTSRLAGNISIDMKQQPTIRVHINQKQLHMTHVNTNHIQQHVLHVTPANRKQQQTHIVPVELHSVEQFQSIDARHSPSSRRQTLGSPDVPSTTVIKGSPVAVRSATKLEMEPEDNRTKATRYGLRRGATRRTFGTASVAVTPLSPRREVKPIPNHDGHLNFREESCMKYLPDRDLGIIEPCATDYDNMQYFDI